MTRRPLEGLRVIDAAVAAQPVIPSILADFGAEVIRVETPSRPRGTRNQHYPDGRCDDDLYWEQGGAHHLIQRNKLGIAVEIAEPLGREVFRKLVAISDVVVENSTSATMKKFGLDYERLREVNPGIIMLSITGFGHGGPYTSLRGFGTHMAAMGGMSAMMGYDEPHLGTIPYPDQIAIYHGVAAILAALIQRRRTGKGQWIDLSMSAATLSHLGEASIDYAMNGRLRGPTGNRDDVMVPHGCYKCQGRDNWVVITVTGEEQWRSLSAEMGNPPWCGEERFATVEARRAHQDELDRLIGEWTATQSENELTERLQRVGIAAGPVLSIKGLHLDPHLHSRAAFQAVEHPPIHRRVGKRPICGPVWKLSETPGSVRRCAASFGRDNDLVFGELLGMTAEEMRQLEEAGAIGTKPLPWHGNPPSRPLPPEEAFRLGRVEEYDPDYKEKLAALYGEVG